MTSYYADDAVTLHHGDCLNVMRQLPDNSVDAVVTDPPYGLGFMGKAWDSAAALNSRPPSADANSMDSAYPRTGKGPAATAFDGVGFQQWCQQWASECLRVLKPGGHLLAFGGTRTWHRLAVAVEDAGFEMRDSIAWLYGSGFPKSLDVSKAIDKAAGATREVVGFDAAKARPNKVKYAKLPEGQASDGALAGVQDNGATVTAPATDAARTWQGWGTALKPAFEPVVVGRKPLAPGHTVAANVLAYGTGALNIDACRVEGDIPQPFGSPRKSVGGILNTTTEAREPYVANTAGRWPANVVLDDSQAAELDRQSGTLTSGANPTSRGSDKFRNAYGDFVGQQECVARGADSGGASRFFPTFRYEAKAPTVERPRNGDVAHPTVKPLDLMRWLVRLVTPPGGVVLEPFAGSGTTAEACVVEGFRCIAIEREAAYLPLIVARLSKPIALDLFGGAA